MCTEAKVFELTPVRWKGINKVCVTNRLMIKTKVKIQYDETRQLQIIVTSIITNRQIITMLVDVSTYQEAEQRARRLLGQIECSPSWKWNNDATRDKSTYITSKLFFRETILVKTSKAWTWDPCSQTFVTGFNMSWIWHFPFRRHHSNADCMNFFFILCYLC